MSRSVELGLKDIEHREKVKTRYYAISPTKLELIEKSRDIPIEDILTHPELYTPTYPEMAGAIRGMHGHVIGNISIEVIRGLKSTCPQSVALAPSAIYNEWDKWSHSMSFMRPAKRSRKPVVHEGYVFGQNAVKEAWFSPNVTNFSRRVVEAHRFETEDYVANGYSPRYEFDPTEPKNEVSVERDYVLHVDFGGSGIAINLRADYVVNKRTIIDDKFGSDFDPESPMAILQAGMYALVAEYKTRNPYKNKARADELRMGNMRFIYRMFRDHPQTPHFEYHEVALPPTTSYWTMITPYIDRLRDSYSQFTEIQKRREGSFYLPVPIAEIDPSYIAQPNLL